MQLPEDKKQQLADLVREMNNQGTPETEVLQVVDLFKKKHGVADQMPIAPPEQSITPIPVQNAPVPSEPAEWQSRKGEPQAQSLAEEWIPRTIKAVREGGGGIKELMKVTGASALDLLSNVLALPIADKYYKGTQLGLIGDEPLTFAESLKRIKAGESPKGKPNLIAEIASDEALAAGIITGGLLGPWALGGRGVMAVGGRLAGAGAIEGAQSASIHQASDMLGGEKFDPKEAATEVAFSTAFPFIPAAVKPLRKFANKSLGRLAEELSGSSEKALRMYGGGGSVGAKKLKNIAGKRWEVGMRLLEALDNFDKYIPEKQIVDKALLKMPNINMVKTLKEIRGQIEQMPLPETNSVSIEKLKTILKDFSKKKDLPPIRFKKLRKDLDDLIDWNAAGAKPFNSSLKAIRHTMKEQLVETAEKSGNPQYVTAMKGWRDKLEKRDALMEVLGKTGKSRRNRIESFLSTLMGKNKESRRLALQDLKDILGEDFVDQAQLMQLAETLGPSGIPTWLPRQYTGRSLLASNTATTQIGAGAYLNNPYLMASGALTAAMGSPKIASRVLRAADVIGGKLDQSGRNIGSSLGQLYRSHEFGGEEE